MEAEEEIKKCCGHIPTLWDFTSGIWMYVCSECGMRQYEEGLEK